MTDHIFVGDRVLLGVSFRAARARLGILAGDGVLLRASEVAYGEGITGMVEAAGPAAGLSRLAGVYVEDLADEYDCARIALRWDAIAADGALFAALNADLMLFFFQEEDGIRDYKVTGVQTCALPIYARPVPCPRRKSPIVTGRSCAA